MCYFRSYSLAWLIYIVIVIVQDKENGGISDRPYDAVDVFHTFFGVAGIAILFFSVDLIFSF